ncbi:hypothetical protein FHW84_001833 [Dyella sp. SG562]|uniref:hypothetical protein n=1 Tax=Dyella sp. SG562 TaxID=2587017 RepID=UPI0014249162|nr:hypothetical protein [Dyella sp. SG562]NII73264.1 hypothetical protein [Dyella sp. SG562]
MTDVIKEFLVSLGYKIDVSTERKFNDSIKGATKAVEGLGIALGALSAAGAVAWINNLANSMEQLYFVSQRSRASAENIKATQYAITQLGGTAEGAVSSIENLARFLRTNPAGESLIRAIGVQTRDGQGNLRDTSDLLEDIGEHLRKMQPYMQYRYANLLGIDEKTLLALDQGVGQFSRHYHEMLAKMGIDYDKVTKQGRNFMLRMRDAKVVLESVGITIGTRVLGVLDELIHRWDSLDETTKDNIETFGKWVAGIVAGLTILNSGPIGIIAALAAGIVALWDDYKVWKEGGQHLIDWDKWAPGVEAAIEGLKKLIGFLEKTYQWMEKVSDKILGGTKAGDTIGNAAAHVAAFFGSQEAQDAIDRSNWASLTTEQRNQRIAAWKALTPAERASTHLSAEQIRLLGSDPGATGAASSAAGSPIGIRNNNPGNLRTGPGGSFGTYGSPAEGLSALYRQLNLYYTGQSAAAGHKPLQSVRDIISTYAPKNENNTAAYIRAVSDQMGVSPDAQLNLNDPTQMTALMKGIVQHENGQNPYSAEMFNRAVGAGGTTSRAPGTLNANTTIVVQGANDPMRTAQLVADAQGETSQRQLRNYEAASTQ